MKTKALLSALVLGAGLSLSTGVAYAQEPPSNEELKGQIDALECNATYNEDVGRIRDHLFTAIDNGTYSYALSGRFRDKQSNLNHCIGIPEVGNTEPPESPVPTPPENEETAPPVDESQESEPTEEVTTPPVVENAETVIPTEDDDSEADTSGDQVTVVPEGSVDTGTA